MLHVKRVSVQSFGEKIVFVHKDCSTYKVDDIRTLTRVEIHGAQKPLYAFLNVIEDENIVSPSEIGLNDEAFLSLGLPEGALVSLLQSDIPQSMESVIKKAQGYALSSNEYISIVNDIASGRYSNADITAFITAFSSYATINEIVYLTQALSFGNKLYWDEENIVADTHTLGYIPANSTDILTTAIVSAYGLPILKSVILNPLACLGEAHTMQVFANLDNDELALSHMIKDTKGAIFNYESMKGSEAAIRIRNIMHYLNLKDYNMEIALLLAMKHSCGISHLIVDIPVGYQSLIRNIKESVKVRKTLEFVARELGMTIEVLITDGREPVGYGIGSVLEAKDIMQILRGKDEAPLDLAEKAIYMASKVIEFDPKVKGGEGYQIAKEMIDSGRALDSFENIINTQGKLQSADLGTFVRNILAHKSGEIKSINNNILTHIATTAGATGNAGSGVLLMKKVTDRVTKGDVLYRIYSNNSADLTLASSMCENANGFEIGK